MLACVDGAVAVDVVELEVDDAVAVPVHTVGLPAVEEIVSVGVERAAVGALFGVRRHLRCVDEDQQLLIRIQRDVRRVDQLCDLFLVGVVEDEVTHVRLVDAAEGRNALDLALQVERILVVERSDRRVDFEEDVEEAVGLKLEYARLIVLLLGDLAN